MCVQISNLENKDCRINFSLSLGEINFDLLKIYSVISLLMFIILEEGPISGSENFDEISTRTL